MKLVKYASILLLSIAFSVYATAAANEDDDHDSYEVSYPVQVSLISMDESRLNHLKIQITRSFLGVETVNSASDPLDPSKAGSGFDSDENTSMDSLMADPPSEPRDVQGNSSQEILLPDLQNLPPTDLQLTFDRVSGGKYIRFTTEIWNSGPGKVELIGQTDDYTGRIMVEQQLFNSNDQLVTSVEVGEFVYHPEHYHMHLENFAQYEVWSIKKDFSLDRVAASGGKISYCVMDAEPIERHGSNPDYPEEPVYIDCAADFQGLSPGWIDVYEFNLPDQWVDITDLPNGIYAVVSSVNPDHTLQEKSLYNNQGVTYFILEDFEVRMIKGSLPLGHLQK